MERLALQYSDGSLGVLTAGRTLDDAKDECQAADRNERDPANLTKVVRVQCEVIKVIYEASPSAPASEVEQLQAEIASLKSQLRKQAP